MKYFLIFAVFFMPFTSFTAFSQGNEVGSESDLELVKDTVSFAYKFFPGDKLVYKVESKDSIIFDFGDPLVRSRYERFRVECDSVSADGLFHLSLTYTDYIAEESFGEMKNVRRDTSPWSNRTIKLTIDSLGKRYSVKPDNYNLAAIAPGGAFQPYLFFSFEENRKAVNESWYIAGTDSLYENGVPAAMLEHNNLFRAGADIDTLDYKCSQFRFVRTANGSFSMKTNEQSIATTVVINSGGNLMISKELQIPIHLFQTIEQKLRVYLSEDSVKIGTHFSNTTFVLESISRVR